jgi:hypothetical protein
MFEPAGERHFNKSFRLVAAFFPPEPERGCLVAADDHAGVRDAGKIAAVSGPHADRR